MSASAELGPERFHRGLVLLTGLGFAVRALFLILEPKIPLMGDESSWADLAIHGLAGLRHPLSPWTRHLIFYPPAYPYFIAVPFYLSGSLVLAKWLQVGLGALLVPAVGLVGKRAFSPRVGLLAAGIASVYPELVWFSAHIWSETLFMVLLWWALERAFAADATGRASAAIAGGVLCGLAALTRETALPLAPLSGLWLAWTGLGPRAESDGSTQVTNRRAITRGAAFVLAAVLTVVPWTVRNWIVFRAFVPISTFGALNVWQGNAELERDELYRQSDSVDGPIAQYRMAWAKAGEAIARRQPAWIVEKTIGEVPNFWEAWSEALSFAADGAYGELGTSRMLALKVVLLGPYLLVLALGIPGLALFPWTRPRLLLLAFLVYYVLIHVITYGAHRFHLPIVPLVSLWAAAVVEAAWTGQLATTTKPRKVAAVALGLVVVACVLPSLIAGRPAEH
jgi:asparagine N-glycosylation enzyme membrane subunit Stt3